MMLDLANETIFSFLDHPPSLDDDCDDDTAAWDAPGDACRVRKISAAGAVIRTADAAAVGERMTLPLTPRHDVAGVVVWQRGGDAGIAFDERLDVLGSIARHLADQPGERRKMPRIELSCTAHLQTRTATEFVKTRDISQGGIKIETGLSLTPGDSVEITLDGLAPMSGIVRWRRRSQAGIEFAEELGWQELMPWLRETTLRAARTTRVAPQASRPALAQLDQRDMGEAVPLSIAARVREGTRRWNVTVTSLSTGGVDFECVAPLGLGTLVWVILPGLEGWPARITRIDGSRFSGDFSHPLDPAVRERIVSCASGQGRYRA